MRSFVKLFLTAALALVVGVPAVSAFAFTAPTKTAEMASFSGQFDIVATAIKVDIDHASMVNADDKVTVNDFPVVVGGNPLMMQRGGKKHGDTAKFTASTAEFGGGNKVALGAAGGGTIHDMAGVLSPAFANAPDNPS